MNTSNIWEGVISYAKKLPNQNEATNKKYNAAWVVENKNVSCNWDNK